MFKRCRISTTMLCEDVDAVLVSSTACWVAAEMALDEIVRNLEVKVSVSSCKLPLSYDNMVELLA